MRLKACIAKGVKEYDFPPDPRIIGQIYSHNLAVLLRVAGLEDATEADARADPVFSANWDKVLDWSEQSRYARRTAIEADPLIQAIAARAMECCHG